MKLATCTIVGLGKLSGSRNHNLPKSNDRESHDDYRARTWKEHFYYNADGAAELQPMALKNCLTDVARYLKMKFKGAATFAKLFEAGILCVNPAPFLSTDGAPITRDHVLGEDLFLPSDGIRGSGKRVWKTYPYIVDWKANVEAIIVDEQITDKVFKEHIEKAGLLVGLGRFRPARNGYYGRFKVENLQISPFDG